MSWHAFVVFALGPTGNEKYCIDVSHLGPTKACYVAHRSHRMQKQMFGVTYQACYLLDPHRAQPSMKNIALIFHAPDAPERTT
jgi:hypothetical protein